MRNGVQRSCWCCWKERIERLLSWSYSWRQVWWLSRLHYRLGNKVHYQAAIKWSALNSCNNWNLKRRKLSSWSDSWARCWRKRRRKRSRWKSTSSGWRAFYCKWTVKNRPTRITWKAVQGRSRISNSSCKPSTSTLNGQSLTSSTT